MAFIDTDRGKYAVKCKIKDVEFYATGLSGGIKRRILEFEGVGREGADTHDTGRGAKKYSITANLLESDYEKLEAIVDRGEVVPFTPPLFGVHRGRVSSLQFSASFEERVEVTLEVIKEGFRQRSNSPSVSSSSAAQNSKNRAGDVFSGLDDWLTLPISDSFSDSIDSFDSAWGTFDGHLDSIMSGDGTDWGSLTAAFNDLGNATKSLIDEVDAVWEDVTATVNNEIKALESSLTEDLYGLMSASRQVINAEAQKFTHLWRDISTNAAVSVEELVEDWIGEPTEENIARLLARNPHIMSLGCIVPGTNIAVPIV